MSPKEVFTSFCNQYLDQPVPQSVCAHCLLGSCVSVCTMRCFRAGALRHNFQFCRCNRNTEHYCLPTNTRSTPIRFCWEQGLCWLKDQTPTSSSRSTGCKGFSWDLKLLSTNQQQSRDNTFFINFNIILKPAEFLLLSRISHRLFPRGCDSTCSTSRPAGTSQQRLNESPQRNTFICPGKRVKRFPLVSNGYANIITETASSPSTEIFWYWICLVWLHCWLSPILCILERDRSP